MVCEKCQAPQKTVWPPTSSRPTLDKVEQNGWYTLSECSRCCALWVSAPYEPYASFVYEIGWPYSRLEFTTISALQDGRVISSWCDTKIRQAWSGMDSSDLAAVEVHRRRSFGRNPIDEPAPQQEPDLSAYLQVD
jgi:hypothetical protein